MANDKKDFKEVKVKIQGGQKEFTETLSRSMLYSGVNIFGQLTELYMKSKDDFTQVTMQRSSSQSASAGQGQGSDMMNLDQQVLQIFKKMQKRDPITKVKAFAELNEYWTNLENESVPKDQEAEAKFQNLLTFFLYHMCRILLNEPDKKVREAAHGTLSVIIQKGKKRLGPHIKKIFPLWFCSFYDPSNDVAKTARRNFDTAFLPAKQPAVFKIAFKNFLHFAFEQLKQGDDDASQANKRSGDSVERICASVFMALAESFNFVEKWKDQADKDYFQKKLIEIFDLELDVQKPAPQKQEKQEDEQDIDTTAKNKKKQQIPKAKKPQTKFIWSFLSGQRSGRVQAACLQFVAAFVVHMPNDFVGQHIPQLAPIVFNLVADDNSFIQTTLWKEAVFTIAKNFPEQTWKAVAIKKMLLPKVYTCLKESAFGAPVSLYENFVKFVSVCPLYHITPDQIEAQAGDKQNKASFKERCNMIRETMQHMYAGLKNEESVTFHAELVNGYFETLTFVLLKRIQPLWENEDVSDEDKEFALKQVQKAIEIPVEDFISNYQKFQSKVQNERNIRQTQPQKLAQMILDISKREISEEVFYQICTIIAQCLTPGKRNTARILTSLVRILPQIPDSYASIVTQNILAEYISTLISQVSEQAEQLSKSTIGALKESSANLARLMYTLNKKQFTHDEFEKRFAADFVPDLDINGIITNIVKKEEAAAKKLSKDDLNSFMTIKKYLIESSILFINSGWQREDFIQSYSDLLQTTILKPGENFDQKIFTFEKQVFMPYFSPTVTDSKVDFKQYFQTIKNNETLHQLMFGTMSVKMLGQRHFVHYQGLVEDSIQTSVQEPESALLTEADCGKIKDFIIQHLSSESANDLETVGAYFKTISELVYHPDASNDRLRELLFQKLLTMRPDGKKVSEHYEMLWEIFIKAVKPKTDKMANFREICIVKLQQSLSSLIQEDQKNIKEVISFYQQTDIIQRFVQRLIEVEDRAEVMKRIFLREENFARIEENSLPLKMFKELFLSGGISFDVQDLLVQKANDKFTHVWLASTFLNFKHMASLSSFLDLKKQLVIFVETDVMPALIQIAQSDQVDLILQICKELSTRAFESQNSQTQISNMRTFEFLLQTLVDPGEDFPVTEKPVLKLDNFTQIFKSVALEICSTLKETKFATQVLSQMQLELTVRLLKQTSYFILSESIIKDLCDIASSNLKNAVDSKEEGKTKEPLENGSSSVSLYQIPNVLTQIKLYLALSDHFTTSQEDLDQTQLFKVHLLNLLTVEDKSADKSPQLEREFQLLAIQLCGELLDSSKISVQTIKANVNSDDLHGCLMDILESADEATSGENCEVFIHLCKVIRKTVDWTVSGPAIVGMLIQAVKDKAAIFDAKMDQQVKSMSGQVEPFEFEMLQEMAETLLVCTAFIKEELLQANVEDNLYYLVSCSIEPLQKASFVLLRFIYENFMLPVEHVATHEQEMAMLQLTAQNMEENKQEESEEEAKKGDMFENIQKEQQNTSIAFKNVPKNLIKILENPPNIKTEGFKKSSKNSSEGALYSEINSLVFGESIEGAMSTKIFGYLLAWNAMLAKIEFGRIKAQFQNQGHPYTEVLTALTDYLESKSDVYQIMLIALVPFLPDMHKSAAQGYKQDLKQFAPEYCSLSSLRQNQIYVLHTLINFMKSFPSSARKFYQESDKSLLEIVLPYIKNIVSPAILENEIKKIEMSQLELGTENDLTFVLYRSTNEVQATYVKSEELTYKITLKIPTDYPLKSVVVEIGNDVKQKSASIRKQTLSIRNLIQSRNGDIISAILMWKSNIDKETEGLEECYICYAVKHGTDNSLPTMQCHNCKNKFHVSCMRKWFNTSNKSNCPLCQTFFFK